MIISKTPYRVSFAGGLSDLESYYKNNIGYVVSTTIDKYIYIAINKMFDGKYKLGYSNNEVVDEIDDIKHPLIRECFRYVDIEPIGLASTADVMGGSGLGSSSAFTVGLLNALYRYKGIKRNRYSLAEDACKIEIDILGEPIGKQDQYAAAFGGLNMIKFDIDKVSLSPIHIDNEQSLKLQDNLMLFYTGITRRSKEVLTDQKKNMDDILPIVRKMTDKAVIIKEYLNDGLIDNVGYTINNEWRLKIQTGKVTNSEIDNYIYKAIKAGALGCKLCGAGSGGFLLIYGQNRYHKSIRKALGDLKELPFRFEELGSRIIYE